MDEIRIEDLEIYAYHGVFPEEKEKGQRFYINAVLYVDTAKAGKSDDLADSTHYGLVCEEIANTMKSQSMNLIEAAAEQTAERILMTFPLVRKIRLEVRKPEAPIPMNFGSVSVRITRGWHTCYVALGSNLGDSEKLLQEAVEKMKTESRIRVKQVSSFIHTAPYGVIDQPEFLNGVVCLETLFSPHELLDYLHGLEKEAGRERKQHWGPRTLDLDILFYDDSVIYEPDLIIPHIDLENRTFVLEPMCELNPYFCHPLSGKPMRMLLEDLQEKEK